MSKFFLSLFYVLFFSATSGAGSLVCQNLFLDLEIEKSIHDIAKMRFQLDSAKAGNTLSLSTSALEIKYDEKEKLLLNYFTKNNYMSKDTFFSLLKLEIEKYQTDLSQKTKDTNTQKANLLIQKVDGSEAVFHRFIPGDSRKKPFDVMATPTTNIIWQKIAQLIKTKLAGFPDLFVAELRDGEHLYPITHISYAEITYWLNGLNELSRKGTPELEKIIVGHQDRDVYAVPSTKQWNDFISQVVREDLSGGRFSALINQDVTTKDPLTVQGREFYGLIGNIEYFFNDNTIDGLKCPTGNAIGLVDGSITTSYPHIRSIAEFKPWLSFYLIRTARER